MNIEPIKYNLIQVVQKPSLRQADEMLAQFKFAMTLYILSYAHIKLMTAFSWKITLFGILPVLALVTFFVFKATMSKENEEIPF